MTPPIWLDCRWPPEGGPVRQASWQQLFLGGTVTGKRID
jgi:hypothetical protein